MSFGFIFSILLIVFFIAIAFIVIKQFLHTGDCARVGIFVEKFKSDVQKSWNSQIDSHVFIGILPSGIDYVCFADLSIPFKGEFSDFEDELGLYEGKEANLYLYPTGKSCELPYHTIPHLDIENIIARKNPHCISVIDGKVSLLVSKELNDRLVRIAAG